MLFVFFIFLNILSCSEISARSKAEFSGQYDEAFENLCKAGKVTEIKKFIDEKAAKNRVNQQHLFTISYEGRSEQRQLNYPFALLSLWQGNKEGLQEAFKYLCEYMTPDKRGSANYIDPDEELDGGNLIALVAYKCNLDTFIHFINKSGANINGHAKNLPVALISLFQREYVETPIEGCHSKFEYLLKKGVDLKDQQGAIVAAYAFWSNNVRALDLMKKYEKDFNTKLESGLPPAAYAAVNSSKGTLEWALLNQARVINKTDVRKMWATKLATLAMFSVASAAIKAGNSLLMDALSVFEEMIKLYAMQFLVMTFEEKMKVQSWKFLSYVLSRGEWATSIEENEWDLLRFAVKELSRELSNRDKTKYKELSKSIGNILTEVRREENWDIAMANYKVLVAQINAAEVGEAELEDKESFERSASMKSIKKEVDELKRIDIKCLETEAERIIYTKPRLGNVEDIKKHGEILIFFESGYEDLPNVDTAKKLLKLGTFADGTYFAIPDNSALIDPVLVSKAGATITSISADILADQKHFYFFTQRIDK